MRRVFVMACNLGPWAKGLLPRRSPLFCWHMQARVSPADWAAIAWRRLLLSCHCPMPAAEPLAMASAPPPPQVFDASSRSVLRRFDAHKKPVHVTRFSPDRLHVLSGSDDVTLRWWDVSAGEQVMRFDGHTDYIRAAAVSPVNAETWASGGYDHVVKLWDVRSNECVMTLDHGFPVEDVTFFTSGVWAAEGWMWWNAAACSGNGVRGCVDRLLTWWPHRVAAALAAHGSHGMAKDIALVTALLPGTCPRPLLLMKRSLNQH